MVILKIRLLKEFYIAMAQQELASPTYNSEPALNPATPYAVGALATSCTVFEIYATPPSPAAANPVFGPTSQQTEFTTEPDEYVKVRMTDYDTKGDD